MSAIPPRPIVHLELHTGEVQEACDFYAEALGWRSERLRAAGRTYVALDAGGDLPGGAVECDVRRPLWLPYVEVADIAAATARAREYGASVLLEPREGPAGWRSVISTPAGGEIAFWQPKR